MRRGHEGEESTGKALASPTPGHTHHTKPLISGAFPSSAHIHSGLCRVLLEALGWNSVNVRTLKKSVLTPKRSHLSSENLGTNRRDIIKPQDLTASKADYLVPNIYEDSRLMYNFWTFVQIKSQGTRWDSAERNAPNCQHEASTLYWELETHMLPFRACWHFGALSVESHPKTLPPTSSFTFISATPSLGHHGFHI